MNKPTADKCREQFEEWAINQCAYRLDYSDETKQNYRSMKTKAAWDVWQASRAALEIALPILEQQERDEGDWIDWKGGVVPPVTGLVEVRYRNGIEHRGNKAADFSWSLGLGSLTIIAYRIIQEHHANQNGEQ